MVDSYNADFVNPFVFDQADEPSGLPPWHQGETFNGHPSQSMLVDIANKRGMSVSHQYGQITPPNDVTPKEATGTGTRPFKPAALDEGRQSAKSERARNAANQRHAKAKKARKDIAQEPVSPEDEDDDADDKRERYREKNRLAAAKCRAKKKVNTGDLEESARIVTAKNSRLRAEERELRDLFSSLRDQALAHDPSQGCNCQAIHSYNLHKAQEAARGAIGLRKLIAPSPSLHGVDSPSPSTVDSLSRTQSFSGLRPQVSQSQASTIGYNPSMSLDKMQRPPKTVGDMGRPLSPLGKVRSI